MLQIIGWKGRKEKGTWTVGGTPRTIPFHSIPLQRSGKAKESQPKPLVGTMEMGEKSNNKGRNIIGKQERQGKRSIHQNAQKYPKIRKIWPPMS
jgi:hypothetical protein